MEDRVKTYKSGLRLINSYNPDKMGATILISFDTGSKNETDKNNGISHLIEHMLFKGTKKLTAQEINNAFEGEGANINAYTEKSQTCFYATALVKNIDKCAEILSDMLFNSTFDSEELEKEKKVIYEEIDMYLDSPGNVAYEALDQAFFKGTKYEKTIIGTKKILEKITRKDILDYMAKYYVPENMIISFAGGISFDVAEKITQKYFNSHFKGKVSKPNLCPVTPDAIIKPQNVVVSQSKDINQSHIVIGYPFPSMFAKDTFICNIIAFIFGGGMSSKLYQEIREKQGLVYNIFAYPTYMDIGGVMYIALATNPNSEKQALAGIKQIIDDAVANGFTEEDFDRAKCMTQTRIAFSTETTINMARKNVAYLSAYNRPFSAEDYLKKLDEVTLSKVNKKVKELFSNPTYCCSIVTKKPKKEVFNILK